MTLRIRVCSSLSLDGELFLWMRSRSIAFYYRAESRVRENRCARCCYHFGLSATSERIVNFSVYGETVTFFFFARRE